MSALPPSPDRKETLYPGPGKPLPGAPRPAAKRRERVLSVSWVHLVVLLALLAGAAGLFRYLRAHPGATLRGIQADLDAWATATGNRLRQQVGIAPLAREKDTARRASRSDAARRPSATGSRAAAWRWPWRRGMDVPAAAAPANPVMLLLANGERVTGDLVSETDEAIVLRWDYGEATFKRGEVRQMLRQPDAQAQPAASDLPGSFAEPAPILTLYLKNGSVMTGVLRHDLPDEIVLQFDYGEVGFRREEIARIVRREAAPVIELPEPAAKPPASP